MKHSESFSSLAKDHVHLGRLFNSHQRALVARDGDTALATLRTFAGELTRHIDYEEQRLLPLYADKGAETVGGTLEIFQAEHRKLREGLVNLTRHTEALNASNDIVASILTLLDEEMRFKGLFHDHAFREQNLLFSRLDELSTEEERKTWLSQD